jgi:hypothetical protein
LDQAGRGRRCVALLKGGDEFSESRGKVVQFVDYLRKEETLGQKVPTFTTQTHFERIDRTGKILVTCTKSSTAN